MSLIGSGKPAPADGETAAVSAGHSLLQVDTSGRAAAPSNDYELLISFGFEEAGSGEAESEVAIPLRAIGGHRSGERWWYRGAVQHEGSGQVRVSTCTDFCAVTVEMQPGECEDVRLATHRAYELLFEALKDYPQFRLVRIWNFLGAINEGREDLERYRQFSVGRADAFSGRQIEDAHAPVGTAIGSPAGTGLKIIGLASSHALDLIENPLQTSAFDYPRQYGPKSPKFSRSGVLHAKGERFYLISGTAAVVGHESAFPFETGPQVQATLDNLRSLTQAMADRYSIPSSDVLGENTHLRVYLRDESDFDLVQGAIEKAVPVPGSQILYLQGDICRRELMVEIEGWAIIAS
jgi:chorismate lyase/3-hydroxybenzoate synthase